MSIARELASISREDSLSAHSKASLCRQNVRQDSVSLSVSAIGVLGVAG